MPIVSSANSLETFYFAFQDSDILNFGTGSVSWFESNGPGCKPVFRTNTTIEDPFRIIRPDQVDGCLLDYPIVEVVLSSVQIFLTVSFRNAGIQNAEQSFGNVEKVYLANIGNVVELWQHCL